MITSNTILCGDALEMLKSLPDGSVNMCVTSPPYYGLRDYGVNGQIGLEETPEAYIARLVITFRELRRVLTDDGTLWLNIADSYAGSNKGAWSKNAADRPKTKQRYIYSVGDPAVSIPGIWPGIKPKDMIGIPWMLAFALRADGWYLRSDIIWHKPNAMPHNVKDRPVNCYEHIFLLSKSRRYYFNYESLEVPVTESTTARMKRAFQSNKYADGAPGQTPQAINQPHKRDKSVPETRRGRDIWTIATGGYRDAHFATFPLELARRCIEAGCPEGGIVIDPFFGSGTTGEAALSLGRQYVGIELNAEYCTLAERRVAERS